MEIHKPKPWHGWRELLKEYAIIVLGVLTALAAEQAVAWFSWRYRAAEAREQLGAEIAHQYVVAEERIAVEPCLERQLDSIEHAVLGSGTTLSGVPTYRIDGVTYVLRVPSRSWTDTAWQSVISEGLAAHLSDNERRRLPVHYAQMERLRDYSVQEDAAMGQLLALSKPIQLDPQVVAHFVEIIERERLRGVIMVITAKEMNRRVDELGYRPPAAERTAWMNRSGTVKFCKSVVGSAG